MHVCIYVRTYVCMYECVCFFCLSSKILVFVTSGYVNNCQNNVATFRSHVCLGSLRSDEPCCEVRSVDSQEQAVYFSYLTDQPRPNNIVSFYETN